MPRVCLVGKRYGYTAHPFISELITSYKSHQRPPSSKGGRPFLKCFINSLRNWLGNVIVKRMIHFIKNNVYALSHFCSPGGRDSRQTFCDVYKGCILLALLGIFVCTWRNTLAMLYLRDWLVISETACWVILAIYEVIILLTFVCATVRRWQDLDIRIPANESLRELLQRPRFWQVLATAEGSTHANQHGPAPKDNPEPLLSQEDLREDIKKQLFADVAGSEEIK